MTVDFSDWQGRCETVSDRLDEARTNALQAALGDSLSAVGDPLPLLHHWLYFWNVKSPFELGEDGHPTKGGFLPPIPLPRRMWAGGRLRFIRSLRVGEIARRTSTIVAVQRKSGRSGDLIFVIVQHEVSGAEGPAIVEEQDIVYRDASGGTGGLPLPGPGPRAAWHNVVEPDPVLLFRYSALTMNGHRIHYDRDYATGFEGYPALVVQGPLQATLLARLAAERLETPLTEFTFRGLSPAYDSISLQICGEPIAEGARLWSQQGDTQAMIATARCV